MAEVRDTKVRFTVDAEAYELSTMGELMIDRDDLDCEMGKQAAIFAWFGVMQERARGERMVKEAEIEELEAQIEDDIRMKLDDKKMLDGRKMTEDAISSKIKVDPRISIARRQLRKTDQNEKMLDMFVSALAQRKDMLISLARSRHLEMSAPSADEVERIKKNLLG